MEKVKQEQEIIEIPRERIVNRIFLIRGKKVMFDRDLAELYGVPTKVLNQAVKRNIERFPDDFMFQLNEKEVDVWKGYIKPYSMRSQIVTSKNFTRQGRGGRRHVPYVFTEQGVAMLSSVLKSKRAIDMNIQIIRTFTKLRELLATNKDLREKIEGLEKKYDKQIREIFETIKYLLAEEIKPKGQMGFVVKS